jgi:hypothetical protein
MGTFTVHRVVGASADRTWAVLVDWPRHTGTVPLTTVHRVPAPDGRPDGIGSGLVARTGVGALAYDDRMTVTRWQPPSAGLPGCCGLRKEGRGVTGGVEMTVTPIAPARCRVAWHEQADVVGVRSLSLGRVVEGAVGRLVFGRALRRLARQAEKA